MNTSLTKLTMSVMATLLLSLVSAASYAGWYCVKTPTHGESRWSSRDQQISIKFKYSYEIKNHKGSMGGTFSTDGRGNFDVPHTEYGYNSPYVCLDMRRLQWDLSHFVASANKEVHGISWPSDSVTKITGVWADVRFGGDCPRVSNIDKNYIYRTWRRSGNHVDPWDCGTFRTGIDHKDPGIMNRHEIQNATRKAGNLANLRKAVRTGPGFSMNSYNWVKRHGFRRDYPGNLFHKPGTYDWIRDLTNRHAHKGNLSPLSTRSLKSELLAAAESAQTAAKVINVPPQLTAQINKVLADLRKVRVPPIPQSENYPIGPLAALPALRWDMHQIDLFLDQAADRHGSAGERALLIASAQKAGAIARDRDRFALASRCNYLIAQINQVPTSGLAKLEKELRGIEKVLGIEASGQELKQLSTGKEKNI